MDNHFNFNVTLNETEKTSVKIFIYFNLIFFQTVTIVSGLISYPLDTVRRRLMMQSNLKKKDMIYKGTMDCYYKILRTEGAKAFYKGALSNVFRGTGAALVLVFYDKIKVWVKDL